MKLAKDIARFCTKATCNAIVKFTGVRDQRGKRIAFISSVIAAAMPEVDWLRSGFKVIKDRLNEINETLKLADNVSGLELPMMMHKIIWSDDAHEELCEQALRAAQKGETKTVYNICSRIVAASPPVLRYGRSEEMTLDISEQFMKFYQPVAA